MCVCVHVCVCVCMCMSVSYMHAYCISTCTSDTQNLSFLSHLKITMAIIIHVQVLTHYTGTLPYLPVKLTIQYHLLGAGPSPGVSVSSCHQQHATQCNESVSTPAPPHTRGKVRQTCHGHSTVSTCLQNRNLAPISTDALLNYLNPLTAKHLPMAAVSNAWEKTPLQMLVVGKATVCYK